MLFRHLGIALVGTLISLSTAQAITHEELLELQQQSAAKQTELPFRPKIANEQAKPAPDLLGSAQILGNGKSWTIVPKTAVLSVPPRLASKLTAAPVGQFTPWSKFLRANPSWLSTEKVNLAISSGAAPLDYARFQAIKRRSRIVIATINGAPVSVDPQTIEREPKN